MLTESLISPESSYRKIGTIVLSLRSLIMKIMESRRWISNESGFQRLAGSLKIFQFWKLAQFLVIVVIN